MPNIPYKYLIAFSYPGTQASIVDPVVSILQNDPSFKDKIFYAPQHKELLARKNGTELLHDVYYNQSFLLVPLFCKAYIDSPYCIPHEWNFILKIWVRETENKRVLPFCLDGKTPPDFDAKSSFFIPITPDTPAQSIADDILKRLKDLKTQDLTLLPDPNIPDKNPNFANRDVELQQLTQKLAADPLLVITGQPGLGKTHLSIHHAHTYPFAWKFTADSPANLSNSLAILADQLGINTQLPQDQLLPKIFDALPENSLLIYDNAITPDDIRSFLPPKKDKFHILITSFKANWTTLTHNTLPLERWTPDQSLQFLAHRTGRTADDSAKQIAHSLAHLPLALEQAAAYIAASQCSYADYLEMYLESRPDLLDAKAPHDHKSIAATYQIIFEKLSPKTRSLLNLLAYFAPDNIPLSLLTPDNAPPDFPQKKLELNDAIAECLNYSLITRTDTSLSLHGLLQQILRDNQTPPVGTPAETGQQPTDASKTLPYLASAIQKLKSHIADKDPDNDYLWPVHLATHIIAATQHSQENNVNPTDTSFLLNHVGILYLNLAKYAQAEPLLLRALQINEATMGPNHPEVATILHNLAALLKSTNRFDDAEHLMRRAIMINESFFGPNHPLVAATLSGLAHLFKSTNRLAEAEPLMRRALKITESSLGPFDQRVAADLNNLAILLQITNRLTEAEPLFRRALVIMESALGANHPKVAIALSSLAALLTATNRLADAEPLLKRALNITETALGPNHPDTAEILSNLAALLFYTKHYPEAEPLMRRALNIAELSYGPCHPNVSLHLNNLSQLLQYTNRCAEAEPLILRALQIDESTLGPNHYILAIRHHNLALILQDTNRLAEAENHLNRALEILSLFQSQTGHRFPKYLEYLNKYITILHSLNLPKSQIIAKLKPYLPPEFHIC